MNDLKIFSGRANRDLTKRICDYLGLPMARITIGNFPDSEISCKVDEDIRGRDVFLVQPTCPPVNENLMELLIMIESCKRASAERITAVVPYFGYARQDRKDEGRVPSPPSSSRTSSPGPAPIACWRWICTPPRSRGFSTSLSITCTRRRC
jgi:ribose-phosphate pyrophosphokinase